MLWNGRREGSFVSGHRFSDATPPPPSIASLGAGCWRLSLAVVTLALLFSTCALADAGADTYKTKCSACHGASGTGETMLGKNLKLRSLASPEVQEQSDDELFTIISKGKNRMPPFDRKLSKDQIRDLVKHIRSLKK
jgi:mono/diheme cytochrome c family protein